MPVWGRQDTQRVRAWREALARVLFSTVDKIPLSGFVTRDSLSYEDAARMPRAPFPAGTPWGAKWEYGWFFASFIVPKTCEGKRLALFSGAGGEQLVYSGGAPTGSVDKQHPYVTLCASAKAGEQLDIAIESYAGHGARLEQVGPVPYGEPAVPACPQTQCVVAKTAVCALNETAYQLYMDVETLWSLLQTLPERSLRAQRVAQALLDFTRAADLELPEPALTQALQRARDVLAPALSCKNGSTAPLMWMFSQSHIDLAWLWPLEETYHKVARTFANQLALCREYPEYRFLVCQPRLMDMLRARHPELWQGVKSAVSRGQMLPEGAFYVECDTNLPSGESLIRQLIYGKRWFKEHFGTDSVVAWQPDTFGFSAALPQIFKGCGVSYFATQKLLRADPECERFPYQHFLWEGLDGTRIPALSFFKNNARLTPEELCKRWETDRSQNTDIDTLLFPFGYGDGGGGATRDMPESARRLYDLEGAPRTRYGGLREYFEIIMPDCEKNVWSGELYLSWHRGTYTAQRRQKALARRAEDALSTAEALLAVQGDHARADAKDTIKHAWDTLLLCQFHDIAAGVGIARVHEESTAALQSALNALGALISSLRKAAYSIAPDGGHTLVNPLPWTREEWVELPSGKRVYARVPALGAAGAVQDIPQPDDARAQQTSDGFVLENALLTITFDTRGRIVSLTDKENGLPLSDSGQAMNDWRLYENVEAAYDAWELSRDWEKGCLPNAVSSHAELTVCTKELCELTIRHAFSQSEAVQRVRLYASSRRVDFVTHIDWHEKHRMLKVHFQSNLRTKSALHEIQFGVLERPAHASHAYAADRYETCHRRYCALCEDERGFALLNNGICGASAAHGDIALTLLRAPRAPDDTCDIGAHDVTYSLYPFARAFAQSDVARQGYALSRPVDVLPGRCEPRLGIACESPHILLETLKPAFDGNGLVARLYAPYRMVGTGALRLPFDASVTPCRMDETPLADAPTVRGRDIPLQLRPFEILTLRIQKQKE